MALITKLKEGYKSKESVHNVIEGSYYIVIGKNGKKYLQIDTYGSKERAIPGKVSQSLQFSQEAINQLKEIFSRRF